MTKRKSKKQTYRMKRKSRNKSRSVATRMRKSVKRKSVKRKSVKRKSVKRKSVKRKSVKRKSVKNKMTNDQSRRYWITGEFDGWQGGIGETPDDEFKLLLQNIARNDKENAKKKADERRKRENVSVQGGRGTSLPSDILKKIKIFLRSK